MGAVAIAVVVVLLVVGRETAVSALATDPVSVAVESGWEVVVGSGFVVGSAGGTSPFGCTTRGAPKAVVTSSPG